MMAKVPPGRRILKASAMMASVACWGSSCMTRHIETRSTELSASPVRSEAACWNLHRDQQYSGTSSHKPDTQMDPNAARAATS